MTGELESISMVYHLRHDFLAILPIRINAKEDHLLDRRYPPERIRQSQLPRHLAYHFQDSHGVSSWPLCTTDGPEQYLCENFSNLDTSDLI